MLTTVQLAGMTGDHIRDAGELRPVTDAEWDLADRITDALRAATPAGLTTSQAARKVNADYLATRLVLGWLVANLNAHTSGNGAWTHYHDGRA